MRRDKRPFVVEVKRGGKRSSAAQPAVNTSAMDDVFQRAESALFGAAAAPPSPVVSPVFMKVEPPAAEPPSPPRRILESLEARPAEAVVVVDDAPRRGRKPGSKNKPRLAEPVLAKRRVRPPKIAGGHVRSVAVTDDLVNAALFTISKNAPSAPTGHRTMFNSEAPAAPAEQPVKRGRGRPRKIIPEGGFPPKIPLWITWAQSADEEESAPAESVTAAAGTEMPVDAARISLLEEAERLERAYRLRAGTRWTRRLRGIVAVSQRRATKA